MVRRKGNATKNQSKVSEQFIIRKRRKPGALVLREIKQLQKGNQLLIPRSSFSRLVREILGTYGNALKGVRITGECLEALHEALEIYMVQFFEDSYLCALHARRVTLMIKDLQLCRQLRGLSDVINK